MGETSLNGWDAISDGSDPRLRKIRVPGTAKWVTVRKEAAPLFACILAEVNKKLIPLDGGPLDGWEYRAARLSNALSNHSSATAVDFRYDVLLADRQIHWPPAKHAIMHKLLDKYVTSSGKRVFGWGGDWTPGRSADEMHLELIQNWSPGSQGSDCTLEDVQNVIHRLGIRQDGTQTLSGSVVGILPAPKTRVKKIRLSMVQPGRRRPAVKVLQTWLKKDGFDPGVIDSAFGAKTRSAYAMWQRRFGLVGLDANGIPDFKSLSALASKHGYVVIP